MGNELPGRGTPFSWEQQFQIVDSNIHDNFIHVRSLATRKEFIGKELIATSENETTEIKDLIDKKMAQKNQHLSQLVWAHQNKDQGICSYHQKFYFAFEKYSANLKEEKIKRQFGGTPFSQSEVLDILHSVVQGLLYLKRLRQPHQRVCLQNIYIRENGTYFLSDPWLLPKDYTSIYTFHLNGFIYPSPQKILYENDMIQSYDPFLSDYYSLGVLLLDLLNQQLMDVIYEKGFRRILEDRISSYISRIDSIDLRNKLRILMSYHPQDRERIQEMHKETSYFSIMTQNGFAKYKESHVKAIYSHKQPSSDEKIMVRRKGLSKPLSAQRQQSYSQKTPMTHPPPALSLPQPYFPSQNKQKQSSSPSIQALSPVHRISSSHRPHISFQKDRQSKYSRPFLQLGKQTTSITFNKASSNYVPCSAQSNRAEKHKYGFTQEGLREHFTRYSNYQEPMRPEDPKTFPLKNVSDINYELLRHVPKFELKMVPNPKEIAMQQTYPVTFRPPQQEEKPQQPQASKRPQEDIDVVQKPIEQKFEPSHSELNQPGAPFLANNSIQNQIQRIMKSLNQDYVSPKKYSLTKHQQQPLSTIKKDQASQGQYQEKSTPQTAGNTSNNFNTSLSNQLNVKSSIENMKIGGDQSYKNIKPITLGQSFKEAHSINESFEGGSTENMSVVIGYGFKSKDSSLNNINTSLESSSSLPQKQAKEVFSGQKEHSGIHNMTTVFTTQKSAIYQQTEQQQYSRNSQTTAVTTSLNRHTQYQYTTPQHTHQNQRYNSTIKQVSQDEPSIQSLQNSLQQKVIQYQVGTKYVGQTKNNKRWGQGIFYYNDGSYYQGHWKDNKMHGQGCLFYSTGSIAYDGGWYMDTFHGEGRIYNDRPAKLTTPFDYKNMTNQFIDQYWYSYEGDFFFQQKHGKGKLKLSNGEHFLGQFLEDKVHGDGKFYKIDGDMVKGRWVNGFLVEEYL